MNLLALSAFTDNYIWMYHDGRQAIVVDPGESAPVVHALKAHGLVLAGILVTHHHRDHVGGIEGLRPHLVGAVYGPARETLPTPFEALVGGDHVELLGCRFDVIDVPGHTAGHIAYFHAPSSAAPVLFCGDALFSGGCGRLLEGTAAQLHASLSKLAALPPHTRVCCAHEYTLANLKFALAVEPANADLKAYQAWCEAQRARGLPSLPSLIGKERGINPFLRCGEPAVVQAALQHGAADTSGPEVFAALRQWKNEFR